MSSGYFFEDLHIGQIANLSKTITDADVQMFSVVTLDTNPIHLDEEAARRVGLDSVIAHGMLGMAFLGQFVTRQLADIPESYLTHYQVRFMNMVRLGDILTCCGIVKERTPTDNGRETVTIECWAQNQKGDKVTTGEAIVSLPRSPVGA